MIKFSSNPSFGFKVGTDQNTIQVKQTLFNQPEISIRLYPEDAQRLIVQLNAALKTVTLQTTESKATHNLVTPCRSFFPSRNANPPKR